MLTQLSIRDFAIIDEAEISFGPGTTVLTGETGAGKSILLDALSLVLGDRAESGVVRHGAERAEISAVFDLVDAPAPRDWLHEQDLDSEHECVLRRVIGADGRSRGYINGRPVPLQSLRSLCESLVDIHGQHEHQSLLKDTVQRELLDALAALQPQAQATAQACETWQEAAARLDALQGADDRDQKLDLLRYQVSELRALEPRPDELEQLEREQRRLSAAEAIGGLLGELVDELYENEHSAHDRLARLAARTGELAEADAGLNELIGLLESARINVDEAVTEARDQLTRCDSDPSRLADIDRRLGAIHELARKHRVGPAQLGPQLEKLAAELDELEQADQRIEQYQAQCKTRLEAYRKAAARLSRARVKGAAAIGAAVTEIMHTLGMEGGAFRVSVESDPDRLPARHGNDRIAFEVSANPGQPLRPLRKVASGGELSRISLAIQLVATGAARIPTLIFDEVDAGIGGATAEIVGQKLATLGEHFQTLCVTHLPQVAARATHHLQVSKISGDSTTRTRVRPLEGQERINEIARMLGGIELTPQSLAHAQAMVQGADAAT